MLAIRANVRETFGTTPDGTAVDAITLVNARGSEMQALTFGAVIRALRVPDRNGELDDVVLGYDAVEDYVRDRCFIGGTVGRFANRIRNGRFSLGGRMYELPQNDGPHHLHGGPSGFHKQIWSADLSRSPASQTVAFSRVSPHGEAGYPATLHVQAAYTLTDEDELIVDYHATTDAPTPINLTQHSYFNLGGTRAADIRAHELMLRAVGYLPTDETSMPLLHMEPIRSGSFDFRVPHRIGRRLVDAHEQIQRARGFDHCFVLDRSEPGLAPAASLFEPQTGRTLDVLTTEPGLQLYTGQHLDGAVGKHGRRHEPYAGLCLETQHFPDSPNRPEFPATILRPDVPFRSRTVFRFGVRRDHPPREHPR